jgi:hypothetical protein
MAELQLPKLVARVRFPSLAQKNMAPTLSRGHIQFFLGVYLGLCTNVLGNEHQQSGDHGTNCDGEDVS